MAVSASFFFPLILMIGQYYFIERPKSKVDLTYSITQEQYFQGEIVTTIKVENIGLKSTGEPPVILEVRFNGTIKDRSLSLLPSDHIIDQKQEGGIYRLKFKNFGPGATCGLSFKTDRELNGCPTLSYDAVLFSPHDQPTLNLCSRGSRFLGSY
jgi:hypothetical protein